VRAIRRQVGRRSRARRAGGRRRPPTLGAAPYRCPFSREDGRPDVKADIEWSETHGTAAFGWGRCTLRADHDALTLRAKGDDEAGLYALLEFIARHLETLGAGEDLTVTWQQAGAPVTYRQDVGHERAAMREFHRRARRSSNAD
jgi:hypothetical protein